MKVILTMVISIDGKSTKGNLPPKDWASKEDQVHLSKLIQQNKLIIMGGNTYKQIKKFIKLSPNILRIVLTRNPEKFKKDEVAGQLEFSAEAPKTLINRLKKLGYNQLLLLTGQTLNTLFLKEKLIDELWLTIEPKIFGKGSGIINDKQSLRSNNLKLLNIAKLNSQGTLLLKYKVLR